MLHLCKHKQTSVTGLQALFKFQPWTFQPQVLTPDWLTPEFSTPSLLDVHHELIYHEYSGAEKARVDFSLPSIVYQFCIDKFDQ